MDLWKQMRGLLRIVAMLAGPFAVWAQAPVPYTGGVYTQDFDSIGPAGTNTPPGWFVGVGDIANVTGPLNVGEGNAGITSGVPGWNFGTTNSADRSIGTAATGPHRVIELRLVNQSGSPLNAFEIRYDGEQWRSATGVGTGAGNDTIDRYRLQFSADGTNYVEMGEPFNFTVPHPSPAARYDGNQDTNRIAGVGGIYAPVSPIPNGAAIYLRWFDFNLVTPTDAYMAIDNVAFQSAVVAPVTVTRSPQNTNGVQCGMATFSISVSGTSPAIQWQKSTAAGPFLDLAGETGLTLVVTNLLFPDDNGAQFRARVSNSLNTVDSSPATLSVAPDTEPPAVLSCVGQSDLFTFNVIFSEAMESVSASNQAAYKIRTRDGLDELFINTLAVTSPTTVSITTTSLRNPDKEYALTLNPGGAFQIREACNPANFVAADTIVPVSVSIQVIGINGVQIWRYLADNTDPGSWWADPDLDDSAWPSGLALFADETGAMSEPVRTPMPRMVPGAATNVPSAFFRTHFSLPGPAAGASLSIRAFVDDGLIVYLNGSEIYRLRVPASTPRWAYSSGGTVDNADYEGPVTLLVNNLVDGDNVLACQLYQNDATSTDWTFGIEVNAVVTSVLAGPVSFVGQPRSATINEGQTAAFSATISGGQPITFQWQAFSGAQFLDVPGQTNASLIIPNATPGNSAQYRVVASNSFGPVISDIATLTVNPDLVRPALTGAVGSTNPAVVNLTFSRPISAGTGGDPDNYALAPIGGGPPLVIASATVNGASVTLATARRVVGANYRLTVTGLRDTTANGNLLDPNPTVVDPLPQDVFLISWNHNWRYETNCQDGLNWQAAGFDDSAWPVGPGPFGFETTTAISNLLETLGARILTPLPVGPTHLAYYFRTTFDWPFSATGVQFRLSHLVDDGAIFHLNGAAVVAFNQTNTPPASCTDLSVGGTGETTLQSASLPGVVSGRNTFAVEIHQNATTSSDVVFGTELIARVTSFGGSRPRLFIVTEGGNVRLTWSPASGTLQFKNNLEDASWSDVPGQVSGNTVLPRDQLKRFYSLRP